MTKKWIALLLAFNLVFSSLCLAAGFSFFMAPASSVVVAIQSRIQDVFNKKLTPVVVVDLDDTVFLNARRNVFYLKKLIQQDSRFQDLANVTEVDFLGQTWDQWVDRYLERTQFSPEEKLFRKARLKDIKKRFRKEAIGEDQLISVVADYLNSLPEGVKFIYLTAREIEYREVTLAKMNKYKLPAGDVVFKELLESSSVYKGRRLRELLRGMPLGVLVATFDDDPANLLEMSAVAPNAIHTQVYLSAKDRGVEVTLQQFGSCAFRAVGSN